MPVAAKFSEALYDRLGHAVADELVEWFNRMDSTYRADLKELNELNFARFDAKLEQRLAEFDAQLERRLAEFEIRLERRLAEFEARITAAMMALELRVERRFGEQSRWLLGVWITVIAAAVALWFRR